MWPHKFQACYFARHHYAVLFFFRFFYPKAVPVSLLSLFLKIMLCGHRSIVVNSWRTGHPPPSIHVLIIRAALGNSLQPYFRCKGLNTPPRSGISNVFSKHAHSSFSTNISIVCVCFFFCWLLYTSIPAWCWPLLTYSPWDRKLLSLNMGGEGHGHGHGGSKPAQHVSQNAKVTVPPTYHRISTSSWHPYFSALFKCFQIRPKPIVPKIPNAGVNRKCFLKRFRSFDVIISKHCTYRLRVWHLTSQPNACYISFQMICGMTCKECTYLQNHMTISSK